MAHVIGIPLSKGKAQEMVSVRIDLSESLIPAEGEACFYLKDAPVDVEAVLVSAKSSKKGAFAGFVMDVNAKAGTATLIDRATSVCLPTKSGDVWVQGDLVTVLDASGAIDKTGKITVDAVVLQPSIIGCDRKGNEVACVLVSIHSNLVKISA